MNNIHKTFNIGGKLYDCQTPLVMGIINLTPDSFFSGSRAQSMQEIAAQAKACVAQGADMLDFGAYSTRPGADNISAEDEIARFRDALPIMQELSAELPISIDTFRSSTVRHLSDKLGHFIVNDISAGHLDPQMYATVAELKLPYIGMHMRGTPQTMQNHTQYSSLIGECIMYFTKLIADLSHIGVADIFIDPGFGFSKTLEQNYELLDNLDRFAVLQRPIVVGLSRKSMIYKLLKCSPEEALIGTTAAHTIALLKGADILRVHDVREAKETVQIVRQMLLSRTEN